MALTKQNPITSHRQSVRSDQLAGVCVCVHLTVGPLYLGSRPVHLPFCGPTALFRPDRIVSAPLEAEPTGTSPTQLTR